LKEAVLTIDFNYRQFHFMSSSVSSVVKAHFPGAVINHMSFADCIFRGVRSTEVVEASGSIIPQRQD